MRRAAFALSVLIAAGMPDQWIRTTEGFVTQYRGVDAGGGRWAGSSYEQGGTIYSQWSGPHGRVKHCRTTEGKTSCSD